jgi:hypothetical protein
MPHASRPDGPTIGPEYGNAPFFWLLGNDIHIANKINRFLKNKNLGIQNYGDLEIAMHQIQCTSKVVGCDDVALPDSFPLPRLALPENGFGPDYFTIGGHRFCSRRFREAVAQPEHVIQFAPVDLVAGGKKAKAQGYRLMRVLAKQAAMDLERSVCDVNEFTSPITGTQIKSAWWISRFVLLDGLRAKTEIFRVAEATTRILVTDVVAERVLQAGCTGAEFRDPEIVRSGKYVERYRTADGVAERRVGFLD